MPFAHPSRMPQGGHQSINVGDTERLISAVAGGCAVLLGLSKLSLSSIVALGAGAMLLARGVTGHCGVYDALEMSTADQQSVLGGAQPVSHRAPLSDVSEAATGELPPF